MLSDDVYRALGVSRDADTAQVKQAYRALALRNHPDRNPDDPGARARFDRINHAYAAWNAEHGGKPLAHGTGTGTAADMTPDDITELFSSFFGEVGRAGPRGADRSVRLRISHAESRDGCTRDVAITRAIACVRCRGTGADDGVTHPCAECRGSGRQQAIHGYFHVQSTCRACNGRGHWADSPCDSCENGMSEASENLRVEVPPNAAQVRIAGKGDEAPGAATGDLVLAIVVDSIGVLVRRGDDVVLEVAVGGRHVLFGGALEIATLDGPITIDVPRGVHDGHTIVLRGRGHVRTTGAAPGAVGNPYREVDRGDQLVVVRVGTAGAGTRVRYLVGGLVAAAAAAITLIAI